MILTLNQYILSRIIVMIFCILFVWREPLCALKGGAAKVNITPPLGLCWAFDDGKMVDIENPLFAKALVLDDGRTKIAIISTDLLWVSSEMTSKIRELVKSKTDIPGNHILLSATHTHYVPNISVDHVTKSPVDSPYVQTLIRQISGAVVAAHDRMTSVQIGSAKGNIPEIAYNRRTRKPDGKVQMSFMLPGDVSNLTFGPIDPAVNVLRIDDSHGGILASVVNYACHPTSGGYGDLSYIVSADYPGFTMEVIEQIEGGICLFTLGTAGDIVAIKRGKNQRRQIGTALGGEALRRLQRIQTSDDVEIKATQRTITLPLKKTAAPDRILKKQESEKSITTEIQAFSIDDTYILGLPGEVLVEVGLEIKERFNRKNLFIVSLSNDIIGYVCHSEAYDEGGYEPGRATNLARGAGEILIESALDMLNKIN